MKKDMKDQKIKCDVSSCKYQDSSCCTLDEIKVSCTCDCDCACDKEETICKSFKCSEDKLKEEE